MEPGVFHFLNQILRRISVIAYFQRLYFINLYQIEKPLENVVIIDRIFPAYRQESLFPENIIGDALFVDRDLITLLWHEKLERRTDRNRGQWTVTVALVKRRRRYQHERFQNEAC